MSTREYTISKICKCLAQYIVEESTGTVNNMQRRHQKRLAHVFALSHNASTLKRKIIASYSYRSELEEIVIDFYSYRSGLIGIVIAYNSYRPKVQ
jgi:hypothetical protein